MLLNYFCWVCCTIGFLSGDDSSHQNVDEPYFDEKTSETTKCVNKHNETKFHLRGNFWIFYNYVPAVLQTECHKTITYTTHADFTFLDNLVVLADRWDGPISIALYSPGDDFEIALHSIAYLRNCKPKIKKKVTFHLFFNAEHFPKKNFHSPLSNLYKDTYNCSKDPPYSLDKTKSYKHRHNLTYPINVGRNIARESATSDLIFPSDVELFPTRNFIEKFLKMIARYRLPRRTVFVLPIFEVTKDSKIPENKTELQNMLKAGTAVVFHYKLCSFCHRVPKMTEWIEAVETEGVAAFTTAKRIKRNRFWEPFYVGTHAEPLFDERLTWEGQNNKMTQAYAMCLLNYDYVVLDNAFLVHKPGIKKIKDQYVTHPKLVSQTNKIIRKSIKPEMIKLYGNNKACTLV